MFISLGSEFTTPWMPCLLSACMNCAPHLSVLRSGRLSRCHTSMRFWRPRCTNALCSGLSVVPLRYAILSQILSTMNIAASGPGIWCDIDRRRQRSRVYSNQSKASSYTRLYFLRHLFDMTLVPLLLLGRCLGPSRITDNSFFTRGLVCCDVARQK